MKVIQNRLYLENANDGKAYQDRTSLLAWFLSVLKWKSFGYEPILYTDQTTKDEFDELGLTDLYDEVHILDTDDVETKVFWACGKILSAKQFMKDYPGEEFMISDLDYIPLADPATFAQNDNDLVSFYHEYVQTYKSIDELPLNEKYTIPGFFTGKVNPVNTCLLYIRESFLDLFKKYIDMELDFMSYHTEFSDTYTANDLMIFLEQRLFSEYLNSNEIEVTYIMPKNKTIFNVNGIHTGPCKFIEKSDHWLWNIWWLKLIREEFPTTYENIISLDLYSDIAEIINNGSGKYTNAKDKEIEIEDFDWSTLEYPRMFEDIYDPVWRD